MSRARTASCFPRLICSSINPWTSVRTRSGNGSVSWNSLWRPRAWTSTRGYGSFDSDAFGEVARLIDIAAPPHRDVIGEQLERNDLEYRRQQIGSLRDLDDMIGARLTNQIVTLGHDRDQYAVAGFHFLQIR